MLGAIRLHVNLLIQKKTADDDTLDQSETWTTRSTPPRKIKVHRVKLENFYSMDLAQNRPHLCGLVVTLVVAFAIVIIYNK